MPFYSKGKSGAVYFFSLFLLLLGYFLQVQEESIGLLLLLLALAIQFIFLLTSVLKSILYYKIFPSWVELVLALMTVTLFTKYFNFEWWDFPSLVIVPVFIALALYSFLSRKGRSIHRKQLPSIAVYLLLILPLFYSPFYFSPREYVPTEWYNRYDVDEAIIIELPHVFENPEAEKLSVQAFELQADGKYEEAIAVYKEALMMEPRNPNLYFDLANCYSNANDLESALLMLDSAISFDAGYAPFYNNRGLLYYKLKKHDLAISDYEKAISLNPKEKAFYANLSLAQYDYGFENKACNSLREAERLGLKTEAYESLAYISRYCSK